MTDKYEKEFPLSGPLTFPGRIDKKLAEVFDRTTGSKTGNKPGSISSDGKTIKDYINLMTDEDLLALANKIITSGKALSIVASSMLTTAEVSAFVKNTTNQFLSSSQFREAVVSLIKASTESQKSDTGTNNTQQPANNGNGAASK